MVVVLNMDIKFYKDKFVLFSRRCGNFVELNLEISRYKLKVVVDVFKEL